MGFVLPKISPRLHRLLGTLVGCMVLLWNSSTAASAPQIVVGEVTQAGRIVYVPLFYESHQKEISTLVVQLYLPVSPVQVIDIIPSTQLVEGNKCLDFEAYEDSLYLVIFGRDYEIESGPLGQIVARVKPNESLPASLSLVNMGTHGADKQAQRLEVGCDGASYPIYPDRLATIPEKVPTALHGTSTTPYFQFLPSTDTALISFDWDSAGVLYYSVGNPYDNLKIEVYKENAPSPIFSSTEVFPGTRVTRIGDFIYFNDGGSAIRSASNYYKYGGSKDSVEVVLDSPYGARISGLETGASQEFFAAGTGMTWGPTLLFYSPIEPSGALAHVPPVIFGEVEGAPGPMAFDTEGNLFYIPGGAHPAPIPIYRWDVAAVAAALPGDMENNLTTVGNQWASLPAYCSGAMGMALDFCGNVYVSALSWGQPSQVLLFDKTTREVVPIATYDGRFETIRYKNNTIYVSCAHGIFSFQAPVLAVFSVSSNEVVRTVVGETISFRVRTVGGCGPQHYQWYLLGEDHTPIPVGEDQPYLEITPEIENATFTYYCIVSDDYASTKSPLFTLIVQGTVPAPSFSSSLFNGLRGLLLLGSSVFLCSFLFYRFKKRGT